MSTPNPAIPNIPNTPDVALPLSSSPACPLVLFPVRLETRFFPLADGNTELRLRVYPDKVHIDTHEPDLTADEITWGQHFWEETWRAGNDAERRKAAWRQLADRFDAPRAAWVARALRPLNPTEQALAKPPRFPSLTPKPEAWTRAPHTRMLPSYWIVLGYANGRLIVNARGRDIPDQLATGPDPTPEASATPTAATADQLVLDKGMQWMVDFDAAEQVGMGIRAPLTREMAAAGLDVVLVLGVKDMPGGTTDWAPRLAELFDAHHYADGLSFVLPGTPSNNTTDAPSGFRSTDPGHETSYLTERTAPAWQPGDGSNADVLTTALGLTQAGPVFANLPNATATEQLDARHMNTALWQATWGYFLLQMLGVGGTNESPFSNDDVDEAIAWARRHFIDYVRASGPLPAVRIGKQPYGILPVTSLNAWQPPAGQQSQYTRDVALRDFLLRLRDLWRHNYPDIPRLGRRDGNIEQDLAEVLSMDGLSSSYTIRHLMGRHYLEHLWVFLSAEKFVDIWDPGLDEPPPEPEPPVVEEPPEDLTPQQRVAWIRAQQAAARAYDRARQQWAAAMRAYEQRLAFVNTMQGSHSAWWAAQDQLSAAVLQTLGVTWRPRLSRAVFAPPVAPLNGTLVQAEHGLSLAPNYITALLAAGDLDAIRNNTVLQPPPRTLLYLLLRHALLLEYTTAAARLLSKRNLLSPLSRREPELVDLPLGQATPTVWKQLETPTSIAGAAAQRPLWQYLPGFLPDGTPALEPEPEVQPLRECRASLAHLQGLSPARLEQLMTGTLDLCAHRLDAWITSFATKRLAEMRQARPTAVLCGGYGWVMNLKPAVAQAIVTLPSGEAGPLVQAANNPGFVHAPSLTQASTVALLRSGHLADGGSQTPNSPLAIDLSSERVRLATWLLDGVRQGQPLGALLGYRFERRLQEANEAEFIAFFRELAPLVAQKLVSTAQPGEPVETLAANNVVDGLELQRQWLAALESLRLVSPAAGSAEAVALLFAPLTHKPSPAALLSAKAMLATELDTLAEAVDAVSDALMAESVYQTVRGNPLRAASSVDAIAGGETPPPELEVVQTPRTGIALTHRLVTLFSGNPVVSPGWAQAATSIRANAEPHLNAWASRLLVNPAKVRCLVERLDPASSQVVETKELRLNQLRLAPLDCLYAMEGGEDGRQAELEQRLLYGIMRKADGFAPGSLLRVHLGRKPDWLPDEVGYGEFCETVRAVRQLLTNARGLDADDVQPPERSADVNMDVAELEQRAAGAVNWLRRTPNDFQSQLATPATANLEFLRNTLLRAASFGVAGTVPLSILGETPEDRRTLLTQAGAVHQELTQRVGQLTALTAAFNPATATVEQRREHAVAQLRLVFGKNFVVLPRFTAANATEFGQALANSTQVQGGDPLAATTWFQRMARVRDGVARLHEALGYAEALGSGEKLALSIAQLPYAAADRWVGLPLAAGKRLPGGKLSLVVQSTAPIDATKPLAGVLIDEWVEVVPNATETTGIALQYDQPNAAPPQTILLAVPPQTDTPWTVWSLQQVLLETLDLARIRAVDSDALDEVGHYLPASYLACNMAGDTVTTDFTTIK